MPYNQIDQYAAIAWAPESIIEIRPLPVSRGERFWIKSNDLKARIHQMVSENKNGANIYAGILPRNKIGGGKSSDVDGGFVVWSDFDNCNPDDAIKIISSTPIPQPSMVVSTGHGAHLFWRLNDWTEKQIIKNLVSGFINFFLEHPEAKNYIDKGAKDPARILRLPGFVNHKSPVAESALIYADKNITYAPDDLLSILPEEKTATVISRPVNTYMDNNTSRAKSYIGKIPGSGKGGRRNSAYRVACVLANDYGINDDVAFDLLAGWDASHNTPSIIADYGENELKLIISNAKKYCSKPHGCLNTQRIEISDSEIIDGVDLSYFGRESKGIKIDPFPKRFFDVPGLIGEVMQYNNDTAYKVQPVLALAGAIVLQAVLCARKITDERNTRTNMYVCGVAESGTGKDHARQLNKRILCEAGMSDMQAEGVKSGSGLINSLISQPALLYQIDEYGIFIKATLSKNANSHQSEITAKMMNIYSSSGNVYETDRLADREAGGKRIVDPNIILYGTTVPRSLYEGLTAEYVTNGFLSRNMFFDVDDNNPKRRRIKTSKIPQSIIHTVKKWGEYNPGGGNLNPEAAIIETTNEAESIADEFVEIEHAEQQKLAGSQISVLWTRTAENADKLALVYAASRSFEKPVIDGDAARWGYGLAEWLTRRMIAIVGDNIAENPFHGECLKIRRHIKNNNGSIDRKNLLRRMRLKARELDEIIWHMVEIGEITVTENETSGRTKTVYILTE